MTRRLKWNGDWNEKEIEMKRRLKCKGEWQKYVKK